MQQPYNDSITTMTVTLGIFVLLHNVRKKNIFIVLISTVKQFEKRFPKNRVRGLLLFLD